MLLLLFNGLDIKKIWKNEQKVDLYDLISGFAP